MWSSLKKMPIRRTCARPLRMAGTYRLRGAARPAGPAAARDESAREEAPRPRLGRAPRVGSRASQREPAAAGGASRPVAPAPTGARGCRHWKQVSRFTLFASPQWGQSRIRIAGRLGFV